MENDIGMGADEIVHRPRFPVVQGLRPAGGPPGVGIVFVPLKRELSVRVQVFPQPGVPQTGKILRGSPENAFRDQGIERPFRIVRLTPHHHAGVLVPGLPFPRGVFDAHLPDFPVPVQIAGLDAAFFRIVWFRRSAQHPGCGQVYFRRVRVDPGHRVNGIPVQQGGDLRVLPISGKPPVQRIQDRHRRGDLSGVEIAVHEEGRFVLRRPGPVIADRQAPDVPAFPGAADAGQGAERRVFPDKIPQRADDFIIEKIMVRPHRSFSLP